MRHPLAFAALATSLTVLVAALREARPGLFFLAFGVICFVLAGLLRDQALPASAGPLFWVAAGAVQLVACSAIRPAHADDPVLGLLAPVGLAYLLLGTVAWVRTRFS